MADYSGQILDRKYIVETLVGEGGMGAVYRGRHVIIGRQVAIKFLHSHYTYDKNTVTRFYREARAAAAVDHKNIIDILDVGISPENDPYMVMEYLEGESLYAALRRHGPMDPASVCAIMEPVLSALHAAHKKGIVHRDLKPENIFLIAEREDSPATVKLIDFGISRFNSNDDSAPLTQAGAIMGTPAYMAPEQIRNSASVDHRGDIYSIGVIIFELLTGKWPYEADSANNLIVKILTEPPVTSVDAHLGVPEELIQIVNRAMSREPENRHQDAIELLDDLKRFADSDTRATRLTQITSGIREQSPAMGSLGGVVVTGESSSIPQMVLSELEKNASLAPSQTNTPPADKQNKKRRRGVITALVMGVIVAVVAVDIFFIVGVRSEKTETPPEHAPTHAPIRPVVEPATQSSGAKTPAETQKAVSIRIENIPEEARVFWADKLMSSNPFKTDILSSPVPLRIEAEGYMRFQTEIIPSKDRIIAVDLIAMPSPEEAQPKTKDVAPERKAKAEKRSDRGGARTEESDAPSDASKFKQGKKGTQIVETFE